MLALGIGLNTAIFSAINGVLLKPLGFSDPDRLVRIFTAKPAVGWNYMVVSYPDYLDWRRQSTSFVDMGIYSYETRNFTGGDRPMRVLVVRASSTVLPVQGFDARLGRRFGPEEEQPGKDRVVLLSDSFWKRSFGGQSSAVGRTILLDDVPFTIIGVLPPELEQELTRFDIWAPLSSDAEALGRGHRSFRVFARLNEDVTVAQAQAEMTSIAAALAGSYPATNGGHTVNVVPFKEVVIGTAARSTLPVLAGAVAFVLLIACANVANLLLARATARRKEFAIRSALGAGRWRQVRQLMTESTLIALAGGALGALMAMWSLDILAAGLDDTVGRTSEIVMDPWVLLFAFLVSLATAVLFGLAPALVGSRAELTEILKQGPGSGSDGRPLRARRDLLIVSQVAMALALVICACLLMRSFLTLQAIDPGFETGNLLTMSIRLPLDRYDTETKRRSFFEEAVRRIEDTPGVTSAAAVSSIPLVFDDSNSGAAIEDFIPPDPGTPVFLGSVVVTPGYFDTMGIPLRRGSGFTEHGTVNEPGLVIINERMAQHFWSGEDPIGKRLKFDSRESDTPWLRVVGVVGDVRQVALTEDVRWETYRSHRQVPAASMTLVARTRGKPKTAITAIESVIWEIDSELAISDVSSMDEIVAANTASQSDMTRLLGLFAGIALALATGGLYGVMSYVVSQRRREIGIRMAIGAQRRDILRLVLTRSLLLTLLGVVGGAALALLLGRALESLMYGVSWTDGPTYIGVSGALLLIALVASYIPARRATKIDPTMVLHE
jgi:putative ABC transport system permease protein